MYFYREIKYLLMALSIILIKLLEKRRIARASDFNFILIQNMQLDFTLLARESFELRRRRYIVLKRKIY